MLESQKLIIVQGSIIMKIVEHCKVINDKCIYIITAQINQMNRFVYLLLRKDFEYCMRNKKLQIFSLLQKCVVCKLVFPKTF